MIPETQIISIYCDIDNFCKELDGYVENGLIEDKNRVERRIAAPPSHTTVQAMSHTAV